MVPLNDLKKVYVLRDLSEEQLKWLMSHGAYFEFEEGTVLSKTGEPIHHLWFIMEGKGAFYYDMNGRMVHCYDFENRPETGGVGGLLPYSRMEYAPGFTYVVGKFKVLMLHKRYFNQLEEVCPMLKPRLIGFMTERVRAFATFRLQQEKIAALGKLAAGIAHELNNPAAAINRLSSVIRRRVDSAEALTHQLISKEVKLHQLVHLKEMAQKIADQTKGKAQYTALERLEREDQLSAWLFKNNIPNSRQVSESFTAAGWSTANLEAVSTANANPEALTALLLWLENQLNFDWLLSEMEASSARISSLVGSIKNHVQMDRSHGREFTDLHQDLENTLTLFGYKIREKNISVIRHFKTGLPRIEAYVGELNQVWSNLIDNAIHALPASGELCIETGWNQNEVTVRIIDNGTGIPAEVMTHIFDPYFTTKKVGEGTGIGLDMVHRIVRHHQGSIEASSEPGQTAFTVRLPLNKFKRSAKLKPRAS